MSTQTMTTFTSMIKDGRYSRGYDYRVLVKNAPVGLGRAWEFDLRCESISYPSQNIETTQDNIRPGPIRDHAFGVNYGSVSGTFLDGDQLELKRFFEDWQRTVFDPESFKVNYYNDYVADLEISHFKMHDSQSETVTQKPVYQVLLKEVFPKTVNQLEVGTSNGDFLRVSVEFQYHHWTKII
jgi:hypothetical protein